MNTLVVHSALAPGWEDSGHRIRAEQRAEQSTRRSRAAHRGSAGLLLPLLIGLFLCSVPEVQAQSQATSAKDPPQRIVITGRRGPRPADDWREAVDVWWRTLRMQAEQRVHQALIQHVMMTDRLMTQPLSEELGSNQSTDAETGKDSKTSGESCGNPILVASGNKVEREVDFETNHEFGLTLQRTYNLNASGAGLFGSKWFSTFDIRVLADPVDASGHPARLRLMRSDGSMLDLPRDADGRWYPQGATSRASYVYRNAQGQYVFVDASGATETYAPSGSILRITNPQGVAWTFAYGDPNYPVTAHAPNPTLQRVTHAGGRYTSFRWAQIGAGWVADLVTSPSGQPYTYGYNGAAKLSTVTYPSIPRDVTGQAGQDVVTYHMMSGGRLQGKSINGVRYSTFAYDADGRAVSSEHAAGVEKFTFDFSVPGQTTITSPLGLRTTYFIAADGATTGTDQAASVYCPAMSTRLVRDTANLRNIYTDVDGVQTESTRDAEGNVIKLVEAFGTPLARTTHFVWDSSPRRLRSVRTATKLVEYTYTGQNRIETVSETNLSAIGIANQRLTTTYSYIDSNGDGLPEAISADGLNPGQADAYTLVFNAGELVEERRAFGSTYYGAHTGAGAPTTVVDANGVQTTFQYDGMDRVFNSTTLGLSTTIAYDVLGNVLQTRAPDASTVSRTYDTARRLRYTSLTESYVALMSGLDPIADALESRLYLTRDVASNVIAEAVTQTSTEIVSTCSSPDCTEEQKTQTRVTGTYRTTNFDRDEMNRLRAVRGNNGQHWRYAYTNSGQVKTVTDATGAVVVTNEYDVLGRLTASTDARAGKTRFGHDIDGRLAWLTDPRNATTTYDTDGLGQTWRVISPDSGITHHTYNASGQRIGTTTADGASLSFSYQADGRLSSIAANRAGTSQTRTYSYDACAYGRGRLCAVVESNGERLDYSYTASGALASQTSTIAGQSLTTQWTYHATTGLPATQRYPNGVVLSYGWADGLLRTVDATVNGVTRRVVDQATYQPFGPLSGFVDATGRARLRQYDQDGRLRSLYSPAQNWNFSYDSRNHITAIGGSDQTAMSYDELGRLKTATQTGLNLGFDFDANSNRTQATYSTSPTLPVSYGIQAASNRLTSVTWNGTTRTMSYDGAGNLMRDQRSATQTDCHRYDAFGRLAEFARYNAALAQCTGVTSGAGPIPQQWPESAQLQERCGQANALCVRHQW
jgi:YD repeat-containing protein